MLELFIGIVIPFVLATVARASTWHAGRIAALILAASWMAVFGLLWGLGQLCEGGPLHYP